MAFAKPEIKGKEIQIAAAFHAREDRQARSAACRPVLAALVNNDKPDVLATAYAPAEPDYAKRLAVREPAPGRTRTQGRFIPPLAKGDHDWMSKPLPAERVLRAPSRHASPTPSISRRAAKA